MAQTTAQLLEADWEGIALELLAEPLGWLPMHGEDIAPGSGERAGWDELLIRPRFLDALRRLNPEVPAEYLQQALAEITSAKSNDAITENHRIHGYLVDGFRMSYVDADGAEVNATIRLISAEPSENDWLAVNQVTLVSREHKRRFDVVLYCNGLPVSIIELKRAGSEAATVTGAHAQLQTYLREFPMAFRFCVFTLASDGLQDQYGTPFTPLNHFSPWNVDDGTVVLRDAHDLRCFAHGRQDLASGLRARIQIRGAGVRYFHAPNGVGSGAFAAPSVPTGSCMFSPS